MDKKEAIKFWKDGGDIEKIPNHFLKDKSFIIELVKINGGMLFYADKSLKKIKSIVLVAIKGYGGALEYVHDSLKKDKSIVIAAIKSRAGGGGVAFKYADKSLQNDLELIKLADRD